METTGGKKMPVDAETLEDEGATVFDPAQGMISHFATCPEADTHRKRDAPRGA